MTSGNDFHGKTVLVTGGDKGIGKAVCHALAVRGATVLFTYHTDRNVADATLEELRGLGAKAKVFQADLALDADRVRLCEAVARVAPVIHGLVSNAGLFFEDDGIDIPASEMETLFAVHAVAFTRLCSLLRKNLAPDASIIAVSSVHGLRARPHALAYGASKAALQSAAQGLAQALAPVRVNVVAPGPIRTPMWGDLNAQDLARIAAGTLLGRMGEPADVAALVAFLLSDEASFITGAIIPVDGGALVR